MTPDNELIIELINHLSLTNLWYGYFTIVVVRFIIPCHNFDKLLVPKSTKRYSILFLSNTTLLSLSRTLHCKENYRIFILIFMSSILLAQTIISNMYNTLYGQHLLEFQNVCQPNMYVLFHILPIIFWVILMLFIWFGHETKIHCTPIHRQQSLFDSCLKWSWLLAEPPFMKDGGK